MLLCGFPGGSCFPMMLVRQVARPDAAVLCAVELLPDGALWLPWRQLLPDDVGSAGCASRCCWFGTLLVPMVLCFALWSCFPMCLAPSLAVAASRWCYAPFLLAVASRWCHRLPRRISTQRLQRSGNLFRTDFRFAPSLPQRFACGHPHIHDGHGRPRSVRKSSRLLWKHYLPSCTCARPGCSLIRWRYVGGVGNRCRWADRFASV